MGQQFLTKFTKGFSLLEVLMAITIFSIFATMYVTSEGFNVADSTQMKEELTLKRITQEKINAILLDPPRLVESLTLTPKKEPCEIEGFEGYEYEITWKRFLLPDINKLQGVEEGVDETAEEQSKDNLVYEQMKENIENMIWQVEVRTINKDTGFDYTMSTWLTNYEHKIKIGI